tara:strand:+ start:5318 stop:6970 length:1653 start_codon:yes stop_codon:yes gene_type:complete
MLISVYNNSANATDFQQDFNENIILPANSTIKMLKAFIPINKTITTTEAYTISFTVGGSLSQSYDVVLPIGTYGLASMALTINDLISNTIVSLNLPASFNMTHNDNLGVEAGAYSYTLANTTFTPNITTTINWNDAGTPTAEWKTTINTTILQSVDFYKNYYSLGVSSITNQLGVAGSSWGYIGHFDTHPLYKSMFKNTNDATGAIPPISSATADYGGVWWANRYGGNVGANNTYCVSICSATPDVSNVASSGVITEFRKQKGIYAMVVVCGQPINNAGVVASKGDLLIWEDDGSGFLAPVGRFTAGIGANDQISIIIPDDNSPLEYWVNFNGSGIWREIGGLTGTRYANPDTDDVYFGFTAYNAMPTPTNPSQANITQIKGSFDFLGDYANWGTYAELDWGGLQTQIGYTNQKATKTTAYPTLAVLEEENDTPIQLDTTTAEKARMPFINVNVNELPIQNYSINDPNSLGLSTSRTVCSISRYNEMGDYSADKNDAMIFDNNTQICPLNNAHEISLSQLTFSLRNADGTLPSDLGTPQGFILDLQPQSI